MPLPVEVQTVTVNFGPFKDFLGAALKGETVFTPSTPVKTSTGVPLVNAPMRVVWDGAGSGSITLPATDSTGLNRTGWTYRVDHRPHGTGVPAPRGVPAMLLPAAAPVVDLEDLVDTEVSTGVVVAQPAIVSVAGLTGAPSADDLVDALDVLLRAAYVPRPAGGSDGQALVKNGTDVEWGAAGLTAVQIAASLTVQAAFAAAAATAQARWNARRQANYDRDNALGFTIFIDSVNGNDANTGASPSQAWKTLGKLTTATIPYGARIGIRRGSAFSGVFTVPAPTGTGSPTNRVVFGAYGQGATPTITGTFTIQQPYIDVQDLRFTGTAAGYALFVFNGTAGVMIGNQVKRCELDNHTSSGGIIMGVIGGLVEDNYFHDIWNNVEYPGGNGYATLFTTGTDGTEVRYNVVRNCYKGLGAGNTHRDLLIHHNIVDKCRVNGIDMGGGGVVGYPPRVINNFVWHRPTTPNGHGIDTQASAVGPVWRNNIVYCDYNGTASNVELYCIDQTTYSSVDVDYNLGWIKPGTSGASYGKLGAGIYTTLAAFKTALAATSYAGKEAHSIEADPLLADVAGLVFVPLAGSPAINAGAVVPGAAEVYLGTAPDLGAYEVA